MGSLLTALETLGVRIDDDGRNSLPFTVRGRGAIPGGAVELDASATSQYVSGLMLSAPRFDAGLDLRDRGQPLPSLPHMEMTVAMLRESGAQVMVAAAARRLGAQPEASKAKSEVPEAPAPIPIST